MMKKVFRYTPLFLGMLGCCGVAYCANPVTLTFENGTTSFSAGGSGTANYLVGLNPSAPRVPNQPLVLYFSDKSPIKLASQMTNVSSGCTTSTTTCGNPMSLYPGDTCCLMLELNAGGQLEAGSYTARAYVGTSPNVGQSVYGVLASDMPVSISSVPQTTIITAPTANRLTMAYVNPTAATATGTYTVTYNGAVPQNLSANLSPVLPNCSNTSSLSINQTASCTPSTATTGSCTITFTTDTNSDQICLATGGIQVSGSNTTNTLTTSVAFSISGYYVFALNAPNSSAPQVVASSNASTSIKWDSSAQCAANNCTVTAARSISNGNYLDSIGDTYCIITGNCTGGTSIGEQSETGGNAAGQCYAITTDATGAVSSGTWYLPAICQMGPVGVGSNAGCTNNANTEIDNLLQLGFLSNLAGFYWSSTEISGGLQSYAWYENFSSGGSYQGYYFKSSQLGVRCARALPL